MDENLNTVNDVQGEIVDAQESADVSVTGEGEGTETAGSTSQPEAASRADSAGEIQSRKFNSWAAAQRRATEAAQHEAAAVRADYERLASALKGYGFTGSAQEMADEIEARASGKTVEQIRVERMADAERIKKAVRADPEFLQLQKEAEALRGITYQSIYEKDIAEINKYNPGAKIKNLDDLGPEYTRLRAAGVSNLAAYAATQAVSEAHNKLKPPSIGAVGSNSSRQKDYYSPAEVDKLTEKDLDDPKILEAVKRSMTKWK